MFPSFPSNQTVRCYCDPYLEYGEKAQRDQETLLKPHIPHIPQTLDLGFEPIFTQF